MATQKRPVTKPKIKLRDSEIQSSDHAQDPYNPSASVLNSSEDDQNSENLSTSVVNSSKQDQESESLSDSVLNSSEQDPELENMSASVLISSDQDLEPENVFASVIKLSDKDYNDFSASILQTYNDFSASILKPSYQVPARDSLSASGNQLSDQNYEDLSSSILQSYDDLSKTILKSSHQVPNREIISDSGQQLSDLEDSRQAGEIVSEQTQDIVEQCGPCQYKATNQVNEAKWFCQECDDLLCHDCMTYHKILKPTRDHNLTRLNPTCERCEDKENETEADFYCNDCKLFLCNDCEPFHKLLKMAQNHNIIRSQLKVKERRKKSVSNSQDKSSKGTDQALTDKLDTDKFVTKFDVTVPGDKETPNITGSAFLPDSRPLLVDCQNRKLKMFDVNYKFVTSKQFSEWPWEVSVYDSSEMAVTVVVSSGNAKHSVIVRLSVVGDIMGEQGKISPGFECWGVSYINKEKLAVTGASKGWFWNGRKSGIVCVYTTAGKQLTRINLEQGGYIPRHISVDAVKSRAYVSTSWTAAVSAIDLNTNKVVFTYKDKNLSCPEGMAVDQDNNLYVCGGISHNIHQVSSAGELIQVLLSKSDGLKFPSTISFTPSGDTFIVGSSWGASKTVQVFKLP